MDCTYEIRAPVGKSIALFWKDFQLEGSFRCLADHVEVLDGGLEERSSLDRFCGVTLPDTIISKTNVLIIRFISDVDIGLRGFKAEYYFSEGNGA